MNTKVITRGRSTADSVDDSYVLQRTVNRLRNCGIAPKGVYRFNSFEEAGANFLKAMIEEEKKKKK